jgi:hypothetical protein
MIGYDCIFSNWIFIWFLVFIFGLTKYNPFALLIIGFITITIYIFYLYYKKASTYNIIRFIAVNIIFKVIPILILVITKKTKIIIEDIIASVLLIMIYVLYLLLQNETPYSVYVKLNKSYIDNNNNNSSDSNTTIGIIYKKIYYYFVKNE